MYPKYRIIGLLLAPLIFVVMLMLPPPLQMSHLAWKVLACAFWMMIWWFTEAAPIPVTSLLPIILYPVLGIASVKSAAAPYANPVVYLFMGGFFIALAMEKSGLHRRIALNIVKRTGATANGIILGFMFSTGFISMWVSNTATTVMMLPIAASVVTLFEQNRQISKQQFGMFSLSLMLSVAYAANTGGMATLIGTPPNMVFAGFMQETYQVQIGFLQWMMVGFPMALLLLLITYWVLTRLMYPNKIGKIDTGSHEFIEEQLTALGKMSKAEKMVTAIFFLTAGGWILRPQIAAGIKILLPDADFSDTSVAMIGGLATFLLPLNLSKGAFLLHWEDAKKLPWGILLLFGGGLALADAMENAGIVEMIGNSIQAAQLPVLAILILLVAIMIYVGELMSNVALVTIFLPVVAGIAQGTGVNMLLFTIPITLASSAAFMLPMGTPPNAIVFSSGYITMPQMARAGMLLDTISVALTVVVTYTLVKWVFGV
ncbi:anion transporter [Sphingobacteriales bacterium UPWRP_1]|nr:anion transporter [Sphingobacteriales bacterium TSM_CSM]PSJ73484.1 anion transporter [Sphingobacteriales bacterium UPWRP_1]